MIDDSPLMIYMSIRVTNEELTISHFPFENTVSVKTTKMNTINTEMHTLLFITFLSSPNRYEKRVANGTAAAVINDGIATIFLFKKPVHLNISNVEKRHRSKTRMLISTVSEKIKHGKMAISQSTDVIILTSKINFSQF